MTRLLVSVRNVQEARAALDGGADIIDVKEPDRGALGRADDAVIDKIITAVNGRAPVSAAMGELTHVESIACNPDLAKVGLADAPADWRQRLTQLVAVAGRDRFVAVGYADAHRVAAPPVQLVIEWAMRERVTGVLIDTAVKDGTSLFDWCGIDLPAWIESARQAHLMIALAGSLCGATFDRAVSLVPDVVAVRTAACIDADRRAAVDRDRVRQLKRVIAAHDAPATAHVS